MKKKLLAAAVLGSAVLLNAGQAMALSPETEMLLELLETKGVLTKTEAKSFSQAIEKKLAKQKKEADQHYHSVQSLSNRLEKLEKTSTAGIGVFADKVRLSGVVEVEATASTVEDSSGAETDESDVSLATAEIDIDAEITKNVDAHVAFLYKEGEEDGHVIVDEGFISINTGDSYVVNVKAGKMYVPFGSYESHFITDPTTVTLGETNDTAVVAGFENSQFELSAGIFKGAVKETGKDDNINSFVGSAVYTLPENTLPGVGLRFGASYLSSLATSDTLQGLTTTSGEVVDTVAGVSGFVSLSIQDRFFFNAEYLSALDDFNLNDFSFTDADNLQPKAWNFELAAAVMPDLELALKLEGSDEFGSEAPEKQYGAALLYGLFENTSLNFEYLYGEFRDKSDRNQATLQLAVEF